jgi:hypothetical protein
MTPVRGTNRKPGIVDGSIFWSFLLNPNPNLNLFAALFRKNVRPTLPDEDPFYQSKIPPSVCAEEVIFGIAELLAPAKIRINPSTPILICILA